MSDAKNFVMIGGSHGIGYGIVERLAAEGHHVHVFSRTSESLAGHAGVVHRELDVLEGELTREQMPEAIDGFVYCPGSIRLKSFRSMKPDDFREDFEINVVSAVKCLQAALPGLKSAGHSSVVLFSSVAAGTGMFAHASVAASKGALEGLTRTLAAELSPQVRVNCLAPALTDTPLASRFFASEEKAAAMAEKYPLKRTGTIEDLAEVSCFLLSEKSSWITGQVIGVDGGMGSVFSG